jgi:hypothetical protein
MKALRSGCVLRPEDVTLLWSRQVSSEDPSSGKQGGKAEELEEENRLIISQERGMGGAEHD